MAKSSRIQLIISAKDKAGKVVKRIKGHLKSLKNTVFSLKTGVIGLGAAIGGGALAKSFIDAARETENYQTRLRILLGSQKEGNRLFKEMADYAGRVPFEYNEIMGAATQLSGIMKGGVDEITQWMPLIGDLAAASGLGIRETTEQVSRMLSAGAASADLFRERGILSMLGFQAGVSYNAEETRKKLWSEWNKSESQFKGATDEMAKTWDGLTSMLKDAWFSFRSAVMESGVFDGMKSAIKGVIDKINELKKSGKFGELAEGFGSKIMSGLTAGLKAIPVIVRGAIKAAELLVMAFSGFKQMKAAIGLLLSSAAVWSAQLINGLRGVFLILLQAVDRIPGVDTSKEQTAYSNDIRMSDIRIGTLKKNASEIETDLIKLVNSSKRTQDSMQSMAQGAATEIEQLLKPAIEGLLAAQKNVATNHEKVAEASTTATQKEVSNIDILIAKYNELNRVKLSGGGSFSTVESLDRALEDEADK